MKAGQGKGRRRGKDEGRRQVGGKEERQKKGRPEREDSTLKFKFSHLGKKNFLRYSS